MLKLANPFETPPGYFRFPRHVDQPITEANLIYGGDIVDLVSKVAEFRIANGMPIGNLDGEVQNWLCENTHVLCRPAHPAKPANEGKHITAIAIIRFLNAMTAWLKDGGYVEQEEAERRAVICAGCKFNLPAPDSGCSGCFGLAAKVMAAIGGRKTKMEGILRFCGACGCSLEVVPFVPIEILNKSHLNSDFPEDTGQVDQDGKVIPCWRKVASQGGPA